MAQDNTKTAIETLNRNISDVDREMDEIHHMLAQVKRTEEDIAADIVQRSKNAEDIYDCWKGPKALRDVEEEIGDCQAALKKVRRTAEVVCSDLQAKAAHLHDTRENLQKERDDFNTKEAEQDAR